MQFQTPGRITLEVCIASVEDAVAAASNGADRLELNAALELGGLTPGLGVFHEIKQVVALPIIVMLRPRAAGFRYSIHERRSILRDAERFLSEGADGIAAGVLCDDTSLDLNFWKELVTTAGQRETVFHRAFDLITSPERALGTLMDAGTTRILTSGGRPTALEGADQIAWLQQMSGGRIEILPAAGIRANNAVTILQRTGCRQVHGSFRDYAFDPAHCMNQDQYPVACGDQIAAIRRAMDEYEWPHTTCSSFAQH